MKRKPENTNHVIDRALTDMRNTPVSPEQVEQAATRVLATLNAEHNKVVFLSEAHSSERIQSCGDFQALIPAYLSASLTPSRKLLFEDHTRECLTCRKALQAARGVKPTIARPPRRTFQQFPVRWAIAAAALLVLTISQRNTIRDFVWPIDVHAVAQTVNGGLFLISGQDIRAITAGERIERSQAIRTGNDSGAILQLADGSRIEMNARSELSLNRASDGVRIDLARGSVIVTAAKQRTGHLYVGTVDCTVSVVGTVFSVNAGSKGSRVSVIEGEVHVQQGTSNKSLHPGQQMATNPAMGSVPVSDEIAWSQDRDVHLALLKEFVQFSQDLGQRLGGQEMRHTSNLVQLVPATTLVFASLPNVSQPLAESYAAMKQRIAENPALKQWWDQNPGREQRGISFDELLQRVTRLGAFLGPEVVMAAAPNRTDGPPVLLADVTRPNELVAALQEDLARVSGAGGETPKIAFVHSAAELDAITTSDALIVYTDSALMVVSAQAAQVRTILSLRQLSRASEFVSTTLYQRVAQAYNEGIGWLIAADLNQLIKPVASEVPSLVPDVEQLIIEQKTGSAGAAYRAVLGFSGERNGIASWLASPGPIGATEFVSPNAFGAAAIVTKDPALIIDDMFGALQKEGNVWQDIQEIQQRHHVDIRYDLATPLGNEFLIAVDGPIFPMPAWKAVVEVKDAARLQNTIQWLIDEYNREASVKGEPTLKLTTEVAGGRTFYTIATTDVPLRINYTFWAGYLIAAPTRSLLEEAMQYRDTGNSLARSDSFRSQFPADNRDNASGFVYQNLQAMAKLIPIAGLSEAVNKALPTLVCLYGESDRVMVSSKGMLGTNIMSLAGLTGMMQAIGIQR